jgi:DNA-binding MarR family transcriptional regulator
MTVTLDDWFRFRNRHDEIKKALEEALLSCEHPVSLNEFYTLYFLSLEEHKALAILDLAQKVGLSPSATSRMLTQFEHSCGVITRRPCKTDKRSVFVTLTDLGTTRLKIFMKAIEPVLKKYEMSLAALREQR